MFQQDGSQDGSDLLKRISNMDIGKRIAQLRNKKNMNIKELAKMTNVTSSLLSQIERGLANPSLNTLESISKALDEPVFSFFIPETEPDQLVLKQADRKKIILPENDGLEYQLLTPDLKGNIEMVLLTLPAKSDSSSEQTMHKGEEVAYVMDGELVFCIDDALLPVGKGDSIRIPPYTNHKFKNETSRSATILFAISPPSF